MARKPQVDSGLFFSPLARKQTSPELPARGTNDAPTELLTPDDRRLLGPLGSRGIAPADDVEIRFRHSGWMPDRIRVRAALVATNHSQARVERFDACGSGCFIEVAEDGSRARALANYCGDRWCVPCMRARARVIKEQLLGWMEGKQLSFDLYTLRGDKRSLTERLNHLNDSFVRLRTCEWWKRNVTGGASCVQITRGKRGGHWHVHLHVIRTGPPWKASEQIAAWKKASQGSFIVGSQAIDTCEETAGYVARYAARGCERDVILDPAALVEAVVSLRGRRMLIPFGDWKKQGDESEVEEPRKYKRGPRLVTVVAAALAGEEWAIGLLRLLYREVARTESGVEFRRYDPDDVSPQGRKGEKDTS